MRSRDTYSSASLYQEWEERLMTPVRSSTNFTSHTPKVLNCEYFNQANLWLALISSQNPKILKVKGYENGETGPLNMVMELTLKNCMSWAKICSIFFDVVKKICIINEAVLWCGCTRSIDLFEFLSVSSNSLWWGTGETNRTQNYIA